ncbi:MAG: hypothetical protein FJ206_15835 [Gemmatimonadetes bacterium]|nr:hypothetical protein [Gemmatimonadota bacterium]
MTHPPVVRYSPGKDAGFSHGLRTTRPSRAWQAVERFLADCADVTGPTRICLRAYRPTEWDDASVVDAWVAHARERFGPPDVTSGGGRIWPSGETAGGGYLEWRGDPERFREFLAYLSSREPLPKAVLGPISLSCAHGFFWRDPDGLGPVPEQLAGHCTDDGSLPNWLEVNLARRSSVQPEFWFPYPPNDGRLRDLLRLATAALPFRLSARHFRLAVPRNDQRGYLLRRFDAAALLAA